MNREYKRALNGYDAHTVSQMSTQKVELKLVHKYTGAVSRRLRVLCMVSTNSFVGVRRCEHCIRIDGIEVVLVRV